MLISCPEMFQMIIASSKRRDLKHNKGNCANKKTKACQDQSGYFQVASQRDLSQNAPRLLTKKINYGGTKKKVLLDIQL